MARCLVTRRIPGTALDRLAAEHELDVWEERLPPSRELLRDRAAGAEGLLCMLTDPVDRELIEAATALRAISTYAVGTDNIDLDAASSRGIPVGHTPDVLTEATADVAMLCLLGAARRAFEGEALLRTGCWSGWTPTQLLGLELNGAVLGIVGMGRIGQAVARRARAFGMRIHYHGRQRLPPELEQGAWFHHTLESLLPEARFLSLHCPATAETERMINAETLALLPRGAVLINTARGALLDDDAVLEALDSGQLFAAGCDVYAGEPDLHPGYRTRRNGFFLPHLGSATIETRNAMGFRCLDNLDALFAGRPAPDALNQA
jgi:lactate dehydrogenase-like 2-hydroxyacid dehydrogenase